MDEIVFLNESNKGKLSSPKDIHLLDTGVLAGGGFGKFEVEEAAGHLVEFFRDRGGWSRFTIPDLISFYTRKDWNINLMFFGLAGVWYDDAQTLGGWRKAHPCVAFREDGCFITDLFIRKCMEK